MELFSLYRCRASAFVPGHSTGLWQAGYLSSGSDWLGQCKHTQNLSSACTEQTWWCREENKDHMNPEQQHNVHVKQNWKPSPLWQVHMQVNIHAALHKYTWVSISDAASPVNISTIFIFTGQTETQWAQQAKSEDELPKDLLKENKETSFLSIIYRLQRRHGWWADVSELEEEQTHHRAEWSEHGSSAERTLSYIHVGAEYDLHWPKGRLEL